MSVSKLLPGPALFARGVGGPPRVPASAVTRAAWPAPAVPLIALAGPALVPGARTGSGGYGGIGGVTGLRTAQRFLSLHEYQSMQMLKEHGIITPKCASATSADAARDLAMGMLASSSSPAGGVVVKAQVLAGGRGLGYFKENGFQGGVHICSSPERVREVCSKMLGNTLVTKQTGQEGKPCNVVLLADKVSPINEKYLALLLDRSTGGPVLIGSAIGGTSIEDIAESHPDAILKMVIPPNAEGLDEAALGIFVDGMQLSQNSSKPQLQRLLQQMYRLFVEKDALLLEVNPLVETTGDGVMACDCKANFDDNASFRQKHIFEMQDISQMDKGEVEAQAFDLNYIKLSGEIGCMVNGAGLAMATMDIVKQKGGQPANFLDVGGGASTAQIEKALEIIKKDTDVKAVLVNIFGGIMRCDIIAEGLVSAVVSSGFDKPIVIRLEGTRKEEAFVVLEKAKENSEFAQKKIFFVDDFDAAAAKVVQVVSE